MNAPTSGRGVAPALADFIVLNEEIAALVRARIPLEPHLARIGEELPGKAGELAQRVGRRMEAGETFAAAFAAEGASLPAAYRAVITAGAASGQLGSALEAFVDSATRIDQLRRVTGIALLYPLVLLVVVCWLLALVITKVVPSFVSLGQYPFGAIAWVADWRLTAPILAIAVPSLAVFAAVIWWWRSGPVGRAHAMGIMARLPGMRGVQRWGQAAMFAEMLLLLVERGVPLEQSLHLAAGATDDARLRGAAERSAEQIRRGVAAGQPVSDVVETSRSGFPPLIRLALRHSADRALLAGGLRQAAAMYRDRAVRSAQWYAEYLPLLLTVAIGGVLTIGFTLFVLWPYVSMLHELAGWNWK